MIGFEENRSAFYQSFVSEFDLSERSQGSLKIAGIKTIAELLSKTESDLLRLSNFGRKSLAEILDLVSLFGWELGGQATQPPEITDERRIYLISQSNLQRIFPDLIENERDDLSAELWAISYVFAGERNAAIIGSLNGWGKEEPTTLEATGQKFGLTRERVRQINVKFWSRLKVCRITPPSLNKAAHFLKS